MENYYWGALLRGAAPEPVTGPRIDVDLCVSTYSTLKSSSILGAYDTRREIGNVVLRPARLEVGHYDKKSAPKRHERL